MDLLLVVLAFVAGLFMPAPYDQIAKNVFSKIWAWITSWFDKT